MVAPSPGVAPESGGPPVSVEPIAATTRAGTGAMRTLKKGRGRKPATTRSGDLKMALVFIAPATIGFLAFFVYPTIRGFYFSLTQYNLLGTPKFIGLDNFVKIWQGPDLFWNAMWVTIEYVLLNIGFQTVIALRLASLMHRLTQSTVLRGALLLPWLISNVDRGHAVVLAARLPDRPRQRGHGMAGAAEGRLLRQRVLGHPDHGLRQRLASHGLHRPADLRGHADHSEVRVRGGLDRRQLGMEARSGASRCRCCVRCWR